MKPTTFTATLLLTAALFCGLSLSLAQPAMADFDFDEMQQIDSAEQDDLLAQAKKAARSWSFGTAQNYLKQAEQKGFAPDKVKAVRDLISSQQSAKAAKERREIEARQLAERQRRERQAAARRAAASAGGGGNRISGKDMQNWCYAATGKSIYKSYCYPIKNSDAQNACRGMLRIKRHYCYAVKDADLKNLCYGRVTGQQHYCYSIGNKDIKNACYGIVNRQQTYCYSIRNGRWKRFCYGIVATHHNCYAIK